MSEPLSIKFLDIEIQNQMTNITRADDVKHLIDVYDVLLVLSPVFLILFLNHN